MDNKVKVADLLNRSSMDLRMQFLSHELLASLGSLSLHNSARVSPQASQRRHLQQRFDGISKSLYVAQGRFLRNFLVTGRRALTAWKGAGKSARCSRQETGARTRLRAADPREPCQAQTVMSWCRLVRSWSRREL